MAKISEAVKQQNKEWAQSIVDCVNNDPRKYVKYKESRPITDIKDLLVSSTELFGDNVCYLQKFNPKEPYVEITYKEVLKDVNAIGTALMARGLEDKRIAIIGANDYDWARSYLAVAGGIGIIVPLDKELNDEEIKNQLVRAEVSCVMFNGKHKKTITKILEDGDTNLEFVVSFDSDEHEDKILSLKKLVEEGNKMVDEGNRDYIDADVDSQGLGVLLFTSGTTGKSKGVMLSQRNLVAELMVAPTIFDLRQDDRYLSFLPLHHTYESTCCFLMALYKGSSVAFCQGLKYITKNMEEAQPTMMLGVPALYEKLYSAIWKNVKKQGKEKSLRKAIKINKAAKKVGIDLSRKLFKQIYAIFGGKMKTLICGGSAINPEILDGFQDFGINALQGYGLTECAPMGAFNPQFAPNSRSVGVPFPGLAIKAIDQNEEGIGELCVKGPNVMLGYYKMEEETAKVLDEEGWFHTGDLGYVDSDGYAYLTGRKKNVIITKNGKNVYPEELEYLLSNVEFIEESFVFEDTTASDKDTTIVASIKVDAAEITERLGEDASDEDIKKLIWEAVDAINADAPFYRKIKRVILRKEDFVKNTSQKLIRFDPDNKLEK